MGVRITKPQNLRGYSYFGNKKLLPTWLDATIRLDSSPYLAIDGVKRFSQASKTFPKDNLKYVNQSINLLRIGKVL